MLPNVYVMAAAVLAGAAGSAYVVTVVDRQEPAVASVVRVVDGETVEVREGDRVALVKLVNVDAPAADECLFDEARKRLSELLPQGTQITVAREGQLVGLSTQDGLVNAKLIDQTVLLAKVTKAVPTLYRKEAELRNVAKGLR
ncbi:hypothetical protein [Lentzea sp. NPDC051838]|uniref:thermonuclease family protein n=1 Tax=Lentzea sp. NPDC051838 TaxID=3154849 RepID=UPI003449CAD3